MATSACVLLLGCAFPALGQKEPMAAPADEREFLRWMDEAAEARTLSERLRTQTRVLEAILAAKPELLAATLQAAQAEPVRDTFVALAWERLTELDEQRALRLLAPKESSSYDRSVAAAYGQIARKDPERAYAIARRLADSPRHRDGPKRNWLVRHLMCEAGKVWLRAEGVQAMKRFSTLSHPVLMTTGLFEGYAAVAATLEQRLALLELFISPETPEIELRAKGADLYEILMADAARDDLAATRTWLERHFPPGTPLKSHAVKPWIIDQLRLTFFASWSRTSGRAAADWLMAQRHASEHDSWDYLGSATRAIAGSDGGLPGALDWLLQQKRPEDVPAVVAPWLDHATLDSQDRRNRETISSWMAGLAPTLREAILIKAFKDSHYEPAPFQPTADDPFFLRVFPDAAQRGPAAKRVAAAVKKPEETVQIQSSGGPPFSTPSFSKEVPSGMRRVFDVPPPPDTAPPDSPEAVALANKLAGQHRLARRLGNASEALDSLEVLRWATTTSTQQIAEVLLAHGGVSFLADDLIEAWVERDWRGCEDFLWQAPLSARSRATMLIHTFSQAALSFPDAVLPRLQEHIRAGRLDQAALNASSSGSRSPDFPSHRGYDITASLARGWTLQNDVAALTKIQALPLNWQPCAFEEFSGCFTSPAAGLALLEMIVQHDAKLPAASDQEKRLNHDLHVESWDTIALVLGRLTRLSPLDAKAWLEADPARLRKSAYFPNFPDAVDDVHHHWRLRDPKAADAWLRQVRP